MIPQISVQSHNRLMYLPVLFHIQRMDSRNYPVHNMTVQHIQIFQFCIAFFYRTTEHHLISGLIQLIFHKIYKFYKKRVGYTGNDHSNNSRTLMVQISGQLIRGVVQLPHGNLDFFSCVLCHISAVIQHSGHRAHADTGSLRNVLDPRHFYLPPKARFYYLRNYALFAFPLNLWFDISIR